MTHHYSHISSRWLGNLGNFFLQLKLYLNFSWVTYLCFITWLFIICFYYHEWNHNVISVTTVSTLNCYFTLYLIWWYLMVVSTQWLFMQTGKSHIIMTELYLPKQSGRITINMNVNKMGKLPVILFFVIFGDNNKQMVLTPKPFFPRLDDGWL